MKFTTTDQKKLTAFLLAANKPHAFGTVEPILELDGSRTITYADGNYTMHDNFFGGEPYGGRQIIHYKKHPVWICVYYGAIDGTAVVADEVYGFLRTALQKPSSAKPYRGPSTYSAGYWQYRNKVSGDITGFSGKETILYRGKQVYFAGYQGGLIDQQDSASF